MVSDKQFWIGLAAVIVFSSALAYGMHTFERVAAYWPLSVITIVIFSFLSIGAFYGGAMAARSANKHMFTNVVMGFTMMKMIFSGIIVLTYNALEQPAEKIFVLPFFILYLIFTVFEVVIMIQQARDTSTQSTQENVEK